MLLNQNNFPYLNVHDLHTKNPRYIIDYRQNNALFDIVDFNDHDYFFVEFMRAEVFDEFILDTLIPQDILQKIREDDNTFLFLSNSHESFHTIVDGLYQRIVLREKIPPKKVVLMNESRDLHEEVKRIAAKYNQDTFKVKWSTIFEFGLKIQIKHGIHKNPPDTLQDKKYDKFFLNFNRRWRPHRPMVVALLYALGLLDKGYVSLGASDDNNSWDRVYWWIKSYCSNDPELDKLISDNQDSLLSLPPMYLDTEDLMTNWVDSMDRTNYLYENSLFSIVNETAFFTSNKYDATSLMLIEPGRFMSEKTFKPIANLHPFIIVSVPGMLATLREMGYKTFSPFIDESYDTIEDDIQRLKAVVKEVERLCNMTDGEIQEFCKQLTPIVIHNYRTLLSKTNYITDTL